MKEKLADYPDLKGTKAAFCWISADDLSSFYIYMPSDPRASYLLDLGLEFPESVKSWLKIPLIFPLLSAVKMRIS